MAFLILIFFRESPVILTAIREARWYWILIAMFFQFTTYIFLTLLFADIYLFFGHKIKFFRLFKIVFSLNYLNQALPSLGLSGMYFMLIALKRDKVPADKSIVAGFLYYIFIHFTFLLLLIYALVRLFLANQITEFQILATLASILLVLFLITASFFIFKRKNVFRKVLSWFLKPVHKIVLLFSDDHVNRGGFEQFLNIDFLATELGKNIGVLGRTWTKMILGLIYSFIIHLLDVATLYVLFFAFNFKISFSVAIIGFVFGSLFAFISLVPAGIGVEEIVSGFILNGFGAPLGIAMLASVVFRTLTFWFNIPFGILAYKDLKKSLIDNS